MSVPIFIFILCKRHMNTTCFFDIQYEFYYIKGFEKCSGCSNYTYLLRRTINILFFVVDNNISFFHTIIKKRISKQCIGSYKTK